MSLFQKATKLKSKLRANLFGPSGSGKTYTALRIAKGLGGKVALIDTERGSASKYSDRFDFDVCELTDKSVAGYCKTIAAAGDYDVLIIDSLSHAWQELLEQVEKLAQAKYRGNTWSAWSEGTPLQRKLVDAILDFKGHIIATMRSKTEWTTETNERGKSAPKRVGLAPEQGKGIEYEFDLLLELTVEHLCSVLKDRSGKFQDQIIDKPGEEFGKALSEWLSEGSDAAPKAEPTKASDKIPMTEEEAKAGFVAKFREILEKERGNHNPSDYETLYCGQLRKCIGIPHHRLISTLEDFTVEDFRSLWKYRAQAASDTKKQADALTPKA